MPGLVLLLCGGLVYLSTSWEADLMLTDVAISASEQERKLSGSLAPLLIEQLVGGGLL